VVECFLAKEDVAGSTPVSRSKIPSSLRYTSPRACFSCALIQEDVGFMARYPSGKGEVCKTFMRRFDPDPRLQIFCIEKPAKIAGFLFLDNTFRSAQNLKT
jgi:hypothetical protein